MQKYLIKSNQKNKTDFDEIKINQVSTTNIKYHFITIIIETKTNTLFIKEGIIANTIIVKLIINIINISYTISTYRKNMQNKISFFSMHFIFFSIGLSSNSDNIVTNTKSESNHIFF